MAIEKLKSAQISARDIKEKLNELIDAFNTLDPTGALAGTVSDLVDWKDSGVASDSFVGTTETATITDGLITNVSPT